MTFFQAIILGIVQGLTEFLPVSSTAHLLLVEYFTKWQIQESFSFLVLVQLGTLLALIVYYWKDLWEIILSFLQGLFKGKPFEDPQSRLGWYLILGTIPAGVAGILLKDLVEKLFTTPGVEATIRLLLTAVLLVAAELVGKKNRTFEQVNWLDALWVGLTQVLAIFPGSSRSGSTLFGGMTRNLDRPAAARFAFLLSIPVMLAAGLLQSLDLLKVPNLAALLPQFVVGFLAAAIVGYLAIRWLLSYLNHHSLYVFAVYCAVLGIISAVTIWLGK